MNRCWLIIPSLLFLSSCAAMSGPRLQPEITGLVASDQVKLAVDKIEATEADYGQGNYLLYYLDRGLVEAYAGLHAQSIQSFEKAKRRFEELYTQSVSKEAASWIGNDYALPYRGADYEYVFVNVFQALNYLASGNVNEALVEARDLDSKYQVVEKLAAGGGNRRFEDNGFARMFMGFVSEATGRPEDRDNARIFYQQAEAVYARYYGGGYEPQVLKERLNAVSGWNSGDNRAVVYVLQLAGFAPVKEQLFLPVPLEDGVVAQVAFPRFVARPFMAHRGMVTAENAAGGSVRASTELGVSIADLAVKDLESRKALALSKAVIRPALKYMVEHKQQENIQKKFGRPAGQIFGLISSLYNIYSERADLRSWQSLPSEIRVARLALDPGKYHMRFEHLSEDGALVGTEELGDINCLSGQTYFLVSRGRR
ncbi:MAG: hypothetical protein WCO69_05035 [Candidatus Omnitrophota bacterium]